MLLRWCRTTRYPILLYFACRLSRDINVHVLLALSAPIPDDFNVVLSFIIIVIILL